MLIFTSTEKKKSDLVECDRTRIFKAMRPGDHVCSEVCQNRCLTRADHQQPASSILREAEREQIKKTLDLAGRRRAGLLSRYFFLKATGEWLRRLLSLVSGSKWVTHRCAELAGPPVPLAFSSLQSSFSQHLPVTLLSLRQRGLGAAEMLSSLQPVLSSLCNGDEVLPSSS